MSTDWSAALSCPLCKEIFKSPVVLKCGHCYCHECVPKLPRNFGLQQCMQCKTNIYSSDNTDKINGTIKDLVDLYKMKLDSAEMEKKAFVSVVVKKKQFEPGKETMSKVFGLVNNLKHKVGDLMDSPKKGSGGITSTMAPNFHGWHGKKLRFTFLDPDTRVAALVENAFAQLRLEPGTSGQWDADKYMAQVRLFDPDFKETVVVSIDERVEHFGKYRVKLIEK